MTKLIFLLQYLLCSALRVFLLRSRVILKSLNLKVSWKGQKLRQSSHKIEKNEKYLSQSQIALPVLPYVQRSEKSFHANLLDQWQIVRGDALGFAKKSLTQYDLVFADPPYDLPELTKIPEWVLEGALLVPGGWFILEHGERTDVSHLVGFKETRKYGHVHFSLFKK